MLLFLFLFLFSMILISSIMSASETALTSISLVKLQNHIKHKNKKNKKISITLLYLLNNYSRTLMTILIVNTLINTSIASTIVITLSILFKLENGDNAVLATFISTILILVMGEIIPKIIVKKYSEKYFIWIANFLRFLTIIFYPFLWWTKYISEAENKDHINETELLELINIISDNGILEVPEHQLVKSAIVFDEKKIKNIIRYKNDVKFLYHDASVDDILNFYKKYNYSRVPIIHHISKHVSGIIHIKDLLTCLLNNEEITISSLIRQPLFMYANTGLDEALKIVQEKQNHIVVIISDDKKNKFLGIITFKDLIQQIIGKVYDEYDNPGDVKEVGHAKWIASGNINVYKFFSDYLKMHDENIDKKIKLLQWFILQSKKIFKNLDDLKNKKIFYKNYSFKVKSINETEVIFEINLIKINKKNM